MRRLLFVLSILVGLSTYAQEKWTIGLGMGYGESFDYRGGINTYLTGSYRLSQSFLLNSRLSYTHVTWGLFDWKQQTFLAEPEIGWLVVKKPFRFYPSLGAAIGSEYYDPPDFRVILRFLWGLNTGLNLDIPVGPFSVGGRVAGNVLISGDSGNPFISYSGVIKYRFGSK